jgi:hypothetical protein
VPSSWVFDYATVWPIVMVMLAPFGAFLTILASIRVGGVLLSTLLDRLGR